MSLATRVAMIEKTDAGKTMPMRLVILRRYISPGDPDDAETNFIVGHGRVWTRLETEDETAFIDRVKTECPGRLLRLELRATPPE
jgi:hypothetical protein